MAREAEADKRVARQRHRSTGLHGPSPLETLNGGAAAWMAGDMRGETVLGGRTCFLCVPDPLPLS